MHSLPRIKRWRRRIFLAGFFSVLSLFILNTLPAPGAEPVKIVILTPSIESAAPQALPYLKGAEMAVAEVNSGEGKRGLQLLLILRVGDPLQGRNLKELRELMLDKNVRSLMGEVPKEAISPIAKLAQERRIPFLVFPTEFLEAAPAGVEPANLFWISPSPEAFQRAAVRLAAQFPHKRYYYLGRDSTLGRAWAKYFWEELKRTKPDAQSVGEILLFGQVDNYGPYIQGILSSQAEVCFSYLGSKEWPRFANLAKKQGYFKKTTHFELESGSLESLTALRKDAPEGVWGISAFPFWALDWKETRDFVARFKEKVQAYPGLDALSGYLSVQALVAAMKKAGSLNPENLVKTLEGLTIRTPVGLLGFRQADHRALWPIWGGASKFVSDYPFAVLGDLKAFGPDSFYPEKQKGKSEQ